MPVKNRIYLLTSEAIGRRLVRANNRSQARNHVASDIAVEVASQDDLIGCLAGGIVVEDANVEDDEE